MKTRVTKCCLVILLLSGVGATVRAQGKLVPVKIKDKWGYTDKKGKVVVRPEFDRAEPFLDGFALVGIRNPQVSERLGDRAFLWGMIDSSGRLLIKTEYLYVRGFSDGLAAVAKMGNNDLPKRRSFDDEVLTWGFVDRTGAIVIPLQYSRVGDFSEGLAAVAMDGADGLCRRHGKFGYIDKTGKMVINAEYGAAQMFKDGKARVGVGLIEYVGRCLCCNPEFRGDWGYVDKAGVFTPDKIQDRR